MKARLYNFRVFKRKHKIQIDNIYHALYARNQATIDTKNESVAVDNLENIFESALQLSNIVGFSSMSLRDLARETGMSMGAIYSYIESKERLQNMIIQQVASFIRDFLTDPPAECDSGRSKLEWFIKTHVFVSEVFQPWFFFAFVEAKSFSREGKKATIESELLTEGLIEQFIGQGVAEGEFETDDPKMAAALVKPLLQDWYLKQWKHNRRKLTSDSYASYVIESVLRMLSPQTTST